MPKGNKKRKRKNKNDKNTSVISVEFGAGTGKSQRMSTWMAPVGMLNKEILVEMNWKQKWDEKHTGADVIKKLNVELKKKVNALYYDDFGFSLEHFVMWAPSRNSFERITADRIDADQITLSECKRILLALRPADEHILQTQGTNLSLHTHTHTNLTNFMLYHRI